MWCVVSCSQVRERDEFMRYALQSGAGSWKRGATEVLNWVRRCESFGARSKDTPKMGRCYFWVDRTSRSPSRILRCSLATCENNNVWSWCALFGDLCKIEQIMLFPCFSRCVPWFPMCFSPCFFSWAGLRIAGNIPAAVEASLVRGEGLV